MHTVSLSHEVCSLPQSVERVGVQRVVISDWIKKALVEKKRLGFVLGTPENLTPAAIENERGGGGGIRPARTRTTAGRQRALANAMRASGQTWTAIATALNGAGFRTRRGKGFRPVQVQRVVALFIE